MYNQKFLVRNSRKKNKAISQINVTPFVDVMLVLLIVFMITAPLLTVGVSVDLPKQKQHNSIQKEINHESVSTTRSVVPKSK